MKKKISVCLATLIVIFSACYKESLEKLSQTNECSTSGMSYSKDVRPVISMNCTMNGCHNAGSSTTFSLESWQELKAATEESLLLKSIRHEPGAVAMPKNVSKLSDCTIAKIEAWINQGALNN